MTDVEEIQKLSKKIPFGKIMNIISTLWSKDDKNGAFSIGPCLARLVPCGCKNDSRVRCNWCAGTRMLTHRCKEAKNKAEGVERKQKSEYEISKALVVSTDHIRLKDNKLLMNNHYAGSNDDIIMLTMYEFDYGFYIFIDPKLNMLDYKGYSQEFKKLTRIARINKCNYINLDRDGPIYDNLNTFDW